MILKTCPDCGLSKPLTEFSINRRSGDGAGTYCRVCFAARSRASYRKRQAAKGRAVREAKVSIPAECKRCPECGEVKPLTEFPRNRSTSNGYATYCKPCHNKIGKETYLRLYGGTREYHLRRRYGVRGVEVAAMVEAQGGLCLICGVGLAEHIDHDHSTGKIRGILCFNCNAGLGKFRDRIDYLGRAIRYLKDHAERELFESWFDAVVKSA
jgi:hypothetical protein